MTLEEPPAAQRWSSVFAMERSSLNAGTITETDGSVPSASPGRGRDIGRIRPAPAAVSRLGITPSAGRGNALSAFRPLSRPHSCNLSR